MVGFPTDGELRRTGPRGPLPAGLPFTGPGGNGTINGGISVHRHDANGWTRSDNSAIGGRPDQEPFLRATVSPDSFIVSWTENGAELFTTGRFEIALLALPTSLDEVRRRLVSQPCKGKQALAEGRNVTKAAVTETELRIIVSRGSLKGMPRAAGQIRSVPNSSNINLRINVRGLLEAGQGGNFADGIIGATAIERGVTLITDDVNSGLTGAVIKLGGSARNTFP